MILSTINSSAYDFESGGLYYTITSAENLTVAVTTGDIKYTGVITIPSTVEYKNKKLTVTEIGNNAFQGTDITSIILSTTIEKISDAAFENCNAIKSIDIPGNIKTFGSNVFSQCQELEKISIQEGVNYIGEGLCRSCINLKEITLPSSLIKIGASAFVDCKSIKTIDIPNSVSNIGQYAFSGCESLEKISLPSSLTSLNSYIFSETGLREISIPNHIKRIDFGAFNKCLNLKKTYIDAGTIYIYAFPDCENLNEITFGPSVTEIYNLAFIHCEAINNIFIEQGIDNKPLKFIQKQGYSGDEFFDKLNLSNLSISRPLTSDPGYPNYDVDFNRWLGISTIKNLHIYNNFEIKISRFIISCDNLFFAEGASVVRAINNIVSDSFKTITVESQIPPGCPKFSNDQYINVQLYVPAGSLEAYQSADGWKNFFNISEIGTSGIPEISYHPSTNKTEIIRYDVNGNIVTDDYSGIVIIRYSDGSTKKIIKR